jgi:hypothetical protein
MNACRAKWPGLLVVSEWEPQTFKRLDFLAVSFGAQIDDVRYPEGLEPLNMPPTRDGAAKRQPLIYEIRLLGLRAPFRPIPGSFVKRLFFKRPKTASPPVQCD